MIEIFPFEMESIITLHEYVTILEFFVIINFFPRVFAPESDAWVDLHVSSIGNI